jgi:pimeloyl-ACP methyl ester carboxylesterase
VFGIEITVANGSDTSSLGRGSLDAFWSAPASANVLILHGLFGTPLDFRGAFDLIQSLGPGVQNIVVAAYPSALGVAANANALYDLVRARAQPGFGCTIIGHSLGGLIGRYLVEQSANDQTRAGWQPGDLPMSDVVPALFMMGTPNSGSNTACQLFAALLPNLPPDDARFVRAGLDLLEGPGTFLAQQNAAYVDNPTLYHTICGGSVAGTDGIVSVASARSIPLIAPESELLLEIGHFELHTAAALTGVAAWITARLPLP